MVVVVKLKVFGMYLEVGGVEVKMVLFSYDLVGGQMLYEQGVDFHMRFLLYLSVTV